MNRGLVNYKELKRNRYQADFEGKSAYCFIRDNKLIKIYADRHDKGFFVPIDRGKICDFSKFSADTIAFPEKYIYDKGRIVGEILPYINSKIVNESFNYDTNIKVIIDSYEAVRRDLLTYSNIDMIDLCFVNILYSNNLGFHLIDTTEWQFKDKSLNANIYRLNSTLVDVLVDYLTIPIFYKRGYLDKNDAIFYHNMDNYGKYGKQLHEIINMIINNQFHFLDLIFSYMEVYKMHFGEEMKTLEDMKEMTKVLKKG